MKNFKLYFLYSLLIIIGTASIINANPNNDLLKASFDGNANAVQTAIEKGAKVDIRNKQNNGTPLMFASFKGHTDIIKLLLEKGADVNAVDNDKITALMLASQKGHAAAAGLLIQKGANVNAKSKNGSTPLLMASEFGHLQIVKMLVEKGADVNIKMPGHSITALIVAAMNDKADVAKFLVVNKADVNAYTTEIVNIKVDGIVVGFPKCSSALHFARLKKNKNLEDFLRNSGAVSEPCMMKK